MQPIKGIQRYSISLAAFYLFRLVLCWLPIFQLYSPFTIHFSKVYQDLIKIRLDSFFAAELRYIRTSYINWPFISLQTKNIYVQKATHRLYLAHYSVEWKHYQLSVNKSLLDLGTHYYEIFTDCRASNKIRIWPLFVHLNYNRPVIGRVSAPKLISNQFRARFGFIIYGIIYQSSYY